MLRKKLSGRLGLGVHHKVVMCMNSRLSVGVGLGLCGVVY